MSNQATAWLILLAILFTSAAMDWRL